MSIPSGCREVSLSVVLCCHTTRRSSFDHARFVAGIHVQCPNWFRWRSAPGYLAFWEIPWILTWLPQMMDNDHVVPLGWKCFSTWGDPFYWEGFCSLDIRHANFSAVEQIVICKQCYFKNAKLMSVLKFLKMHFSIKASEFCKLRCQLVILPQALRSQDTFCNSMLSN